MSITIEMLDIERVIEDEIAGGATQRSVALSYAFGLRASNAPDWSRINAAIRGRWPKGLNRVKELAWRFFEGKEQP